MVCKNLQNYKNMQMLRIRKYFFIILFENNIMSNRCSSLTSKNKKCKKFCKEGIDTCHIHEVNKLDHNIQYYFDNIDKNKCSMGKYGFNAKGSELEAFNIACTLLGYKPISIISELDMKNFKEKISDAKFEYSNGILYNPLNKLSKLYFELMKNFKNKKRIYEQIENTHKYAYIIFNGIILGYNEKSIKDFWLTFEDGMNSSEFEKIYMKVNNIIDSYKNN